MPFRPDQSAGVVHRELTHAVGDARNAQHNILIWFTEMKRRKLYKEFGFGSMRQYAVQKLAFSQTRAGDFNRLAERLAALPRIRHAVETGAIGYTKARELVTVASARTEAQWLETAQQLSRAQLEEQTRKVRQRARRRRRAAVTGQTELMPVETTERGDGAGGMERASDATSDATSAAGPARSPRPGRSPRSGNSSAPEGQVDPETSRADNRLDTLDQLADAVPSTVSLRLTAEQRARYDALWAALGRTPHAETLLRALALLVEQEGLLVEQEALLVEHEAANGHEITARDASTPSRNSVPRGTPRPRTRPPVQIHVQLCPACAAMTAAGRRVDEVDRERLQCDADVVRPGHRNTATIAPSVRRQVLARDDHRCQAPGCDHRLFLEIHHLVPRSRGGSNDPDNLITLCAGCHRAWHEHGIPAGVVRELRPVYGLRRPGNAARSRGAPAGSIAVAPQDGLPPLAGQSILGRHVETQLETSAVLPGTAAARDRLRRLHGDGGPDRLLHAAVHDPVPDLRAIGDQPP